MPVLFHPTSPLVIALAGSRRRWTSGGWLALFCFLCPLLFAAPAEAGPWIAHPSGRYRELVVSSDGKPGFSSMSPGEIGVAFTNWIPEVRSLTNHILLNGSGVALGDVDGDGRCDVFLAGMNGGSALYRNLGGWRFTNITEEAFAASPTGPLPLAGLDATGAVFADLDGDGHPELLVNALGRGTRCFHNDGQGRLMDVTKAVGLGGASGSMSMTLADIDGDGDLDLYVVNYRSTTVRDDFRQKFEVRTIDGRPEVVSVNGRSTTEPDLVGRFSIDDDGHLTEHGEADVLYLNDGRGHFSAVSFTGGTFRDERGAPLITPLYDWGLSAQFRDLNGDGVPDLYVCNDLNSPDRIWLNDGHGQFRAIARTALRKTSWFSMGIDFGDLDRDGHDDFLVTDMLSRDPVRRQIDTVARRPGKEAFLGIEARPQVARNTLFLGRGDGTYVETAWFAGLAASDWSWSPVLLDVDLDGYEDVLITTGFERDVQDADVAEEIETIRTRDQLGDNASRELRRRFPHLALPNLAFRNNGNLTFSEVGHPWGFDQVGVSQGVALADLDGDGDLDVVINRQNAAPLFLRNLTSAPRLAVRLRGRAPNTQAIGARLEVLGGPVPQSQQIVAGGRYLSSDEPVRVFATGSGTHELEVRVTWRSGSKTVWRGARPNQELEIAEPDPSETALPQRITQPSPPLFEDVSDRLQHVHFEAPFDDFERQPLLPRRLSQLGPGVAWGDLDGDGWDDLVIGSGRGGRLGVYLNDGKGGFRPDTREVFRRLAVLDQAGILVWPQSTNPPLLLVAFSSYEAPNGNAGVRTFDLKNGAQRLGGLSLPGSIGPLAMADVNGDGQVDLFMGGRAMPGHYPEPPSSGMVLGTTDGFAPDTNNNPALVHLGMATASVWTDLNGDGLPELVVATEWGPLHFLDNQGGRLREREIALEWNLPGNRPATSLAMTGWWNGVTAVDLDGDGRMDLVACNWGRNSAYEAGADTENFIYFGDWEGRGAVDLLEGYREPVTRRERVYLDRDSLAQAWPSFRDRFATRRGFAEASVPELLADAAPRSKRLSVNTLDSVVLLNRGDHFLVSPLPREAQFAPAVGVAVADFDGDGNEDLFIGQNFVAVGTGREPADAGIGLLLMGDGHGNLRARTSEESGLRVWGEQKGLATADFDQDGRPDLVVTQNGSATRLYRNAQARPGLRVRLVGPPGNPQGVGVQLRLQYSDGRMGPAREIHAGSGYWSQDSPVTVLGKAGEPNRLWMRWPGHAPTIGSLASGVQEVRIDEAGNVLSSR